MSAIFSTPQGTVTGVTYTGLPYSASLSGDSIEFRAGATGRFVNCTFDGWVRFGPNTAQPTSTEVVPAPDFSGLVFDHCIFKGSICGALSNAEFLFCTQPSIRSQLQIGSGIIIAGQANLFEDNIFTLDGTRFSDYLSWRWRYLGQESAVALKFGGGSGSQVCTQSAKGNIIRRCTFSGATEEALGIDSPEPAENTHIVSVNALQDKIVVASCPPNVTGMHILLDTGVKRLDYYEIIAQNGNELTLYSEKYTLSGVSSGDLCTIAAAMVDTIWEDNHVYCNGRKSNGLGLGINVAFSFWGGCYGNVVRRNHVYFDGLPTVGASAFHDGSTQLFEKRNNNSRNVWEDNKVHDLRVNPTIAAMGISITTVCWPVDNPSGEAMVLPEAPFGGGAVVTGNDFGDSMVHISNVTDITYLDNVGPDPILIYDGINTYDFTTGTIMYEGYFPESSNDPADYKDREMIPIWTPEWWRDSIYQLPLGEKSFVTFAEQDVFLPQYDLAEEFLVEGPPVGGTISSGSDVSGSTVVVAPVQGAASTDAQVSGEAQAVAGYVRQFDLAEAFLVEDPVALSVGGSTGATSQVTGSVHRAGGVYPNDNVVGIPDLGITAECVLPVTTIEAICTIPGLEV